MTSTYRIGLKKEHFIDLAFIHLKKSIQEKCFFRIHLFRERKQGKGSERERLKQIPHCAQSLMWSSVLGPWGS